jgi:hypothetical protein
MLEESSNVALCLKGNGPKYIPFSKYADNLIHKFPLRESGQQPECVGRLGRAALSGGCAQTTDEFEYE